jgi:hypothetical protein
MIDTVIKSKTEIELAVEWYSKLSDAKKQSLLDKYYPMIPITCLSNFGKHRLWNEERKL